jgi:hypothetical protein
LIFFYINNCNCDCNYSFFLQLYISGREIKKNVDFKHVHKHNCDRYKALEKEKRSSSCENVKKMVETGLNAMQISNNIENFSMGE